MEKSDVVTGVDALEIEANMPEDARRLQQIMKEAGEICQRNKWNGVAKCIAETTPTTKGCFGFVMVTNMQQILEAGKDGFDVLRAARALNAD